MDFKMHTPLRLLSKNVQEQEVALHNQLVT